jgi:hypothetical protein
MLNTWRCEFTQPELYQFRRPGSPDDGPKASDRPVYPEAGEFLDERKRDGLSKRLLNTNALAIYAQLKSWYDML